MNEEVGEFVEIAPKRLITKELYEQIRGMGIPHDGVALYLDKQIKLAKRINELSQAGKPLFFQEKL